jgi:hypothetical protein
MTDKELMQQALEMIGQLKPDNWHDRERQGQVWDALRERMAQPEQESVKFNCTVVDDAHPEGVPLGQWGKQQKQKPFCYHDGRNIVGKEYAHHCDVFPLYTAPPLRQWQGLTEEDLFDIAIVNFGEPDLQLFIEMGKLVQEELKEKNT